MISLTKSFGARDACACRLQRDAVDKLIDGPWPVKRIALRDLLTFGI